MFGHQSPVPRNNTASYQFPLRKLYNLRSLSWWNLFFWASFLNMDVCDHWIWSLVQIDANFIGKEITFCGLYLLSISPNGDISSDLYRPQSQDEIVEFSFFVALSYESNLQLGCLWWKISMSSLKTFFTNFVPTFVNLMSRHENCDFPRFTW